MRGVGTFLAVQCSGSALSLQGAWVQSLAGKLRSPCCIAQPKKEREREREREREIWVGRGHLCLHKAAECWQSVLWGRLSTVARQETLLTDHRGPSKPCNNQLICHEGEVSKFAKACLHLLPWQTTLETSGSPGPLSMSAAQDRPSSTGSFSRTLTGQLSWSPFPLLFPCRWVT